MKSKRRPPSPRPFLVQAMRFQEDPTDNVYRWVPHKAPEFVTARDEVDAARKVGADPRYRGELCDFPVRVTKLYEFLGVDAGYPVEVWVSLRITIHRARSSTSS